MSASIAVLDERAVLGVEGAEARDFLHSLLTADLEPLSVGEAAYGALLTPQGKILFDLFAVATEAGFLLDASAATADDLVKRLVMYRLRRKLAIDRKPELFVAAIWGTDNPPAMDSLVFPDRRAPRLGYRAIGPLAVLSTAANAQPADYHSHRIGLGIADSDRDIGSGELFPHEANLDQVGGVSFTKGCYVGQEVVSRMEHRGTARSRIVPVEFAGLAAARGAAIAAGGRSLGTVLSTDGSRGLALVRLDRAEAAVATGEPILAGDAPLAMKQPDWARFAVPGAKGE